MQTSFGEIAPAVDHNQLTRIIKQCVTGHQPLMVWGLPGLGKTDNVWDTMTALQYNVIVVYASDYDAVDSKGMPYNNNGVTSYARPPWFPSVGCGKVVIFLDEIVQAPQPVQVCFSRLAKEGVIGDLTLPNGDGDECIVIAAGNQHTARAGSHRMPTHLADRFAHVELTPNRDLFIDWARSHDIDERVPAFLQFKPDCFYDFDAKRTEYAYPTARSWAKVSDLISDLASDDVSMLELTVGAKVGQGVGRDFASFCATLDSIPDATAIALGQGQADVPENLGLLYTLTVALARRTVDDASAENIWAYLTNVPEEFQIFWLKDCEAMLANDEVEYDYDLSQAPVFAEIAQRLAGALGINS
jgi:MoxR-like ATPase